MNLLYGSKNVHSMMLNGVNTGMFLFYRTKRIAILCCSMVLIHVHVSVVLDKKMTILCYNINYYMYLLYRTKMSILCCRIYYFHVPVLWDKNVHSMMLHRGNTCFCCMRQKTFILCCCLNRLDLCSRRQKNTACCK